VDDNVRQAVANDDYKKRSFCWSTGPLFNFGALVGPQANPIVILTLKSVTAEFQLIAPNEFAR